MLFSWYWRYWDGRNGEGKFVDLGVGISDMGDDGFAFVHLIERKIFTYLHYENETVNGIFVFILWNTHLFAE